ncbi:MAG TPA: hypothetical protein VEY92_06005 [Pseudoxanthomonas sp.]|nr:hypothetical protein [Pseudoxanthomonas sp.]
MIQSHLLQIAPDARGRVCLVFDTVFQSKHLLTACGLGRMHKGQVQITPAAQGTLDALCAYAQRHQLGRLHLREIATVAAAAVRVRKALEAAHHEERVFYVCRGPQVYDAACAVLNVNLAQPDTVQ